MNIHTAYTTTADYLRKKLPFDNPLLRYINAIDPAVRGNQVSVNYLSKIPEYVTNVLVDDEEINSYHQEIREFQIDRTLPDAIDESENSVRADKWWSSVSMTGRYPSLCKLALSILTCFHGPQVESSFNTMNDIIDERSGRTDIETYGAIQSVKYSMRALQKSASNIFVRKDKLHDPVDRSLCNNFRLSAVGSGGGGGGLGGLSPPPNNFLTSGVFSKKDSYIQLPLDKWNPG